MLRFSKALLSSLVILFPEDIGSPFEMSGHSSGFRTWIKAQPKALPNPAFLSPVAARGACLHLPVSLLSRVQALTPAGERAAQKIRRSLFIFFLPFFFLSFRRVEAVNNYSSLCFSVDAKKKKKIVDICDITKSLIMCKCVLITLKSECLDHYILRDYRPH